MFITLITADWVSCLQEAGLSIDESKKIGATFALNGLEDYMIETINENFLDGIGVPTSYFKPI